MKVAVIGVGKVGGALAGRLASVGHQVLLGLKDPNQEKSNLANLLANPNISAHAVADAANEADVLIIAAVPQAVHEISAQLGDVKNKVIIDAMNTINNRPEPYAHTTEALRELTKCQHVVKCFNTTGFENMINPNYGERAIDTFVAGNSAQGKATATQLALDMGYGACYDFGGDDRVALLEQLALCWINLAIFQGHGRDLAFKIIKR